ncbi:MAG: ribosome silencing factor [Actinomycetota bacterium]
MNGTSLRRHTLTETQPSQALAIEIARAASSKKAIDVHVLEVRRLIEITDYFVVCSGATDRQVRTIVGEIEKAIAPRKPMRREGERDNRWVLLDYGDVVVHVFAQPEREYYEIERLWSDAPTIDFENEAATL